MSAVGCAPAARSTSRRCVHSPRPCAPRRRRVAETRGVRTADYDFELPPALIAQHPAGRRDESRLLVVHRATGQLEHRRFRDLVDYFTPGDALVVNATRVLRARLLGTRDKSGGKAEIFLL